MNYNGIEIDMLNLGNADSFLVTHWNDGVASRVLIDGGNASDSSTVVEFLKQRGATYLDHVICSHPHDDHAKGLTGVVQSKEISFGTAWAHLPWNHIDVNVLGSALTRGENAAKKVVRIIQESVQTTREFFNAVLARGKLPQEPFMGALIGKLTVCGPSKEYYEELLRDFTDFERLKAMEEALNAHEQSELVENILEKMAAEGKIDPVAEDGALGAAPTEPENNSSTILATVFQNNTILFTADAGVEALNRAKDAYPLSALRWMQIPHHGSRRNVTKELIAHFHPQTAWVSAVGTKKHPRKSVVNAFKAVGATVFGTHYPNPSCHKWFHLGVVPSRADYSTTYPLYEAEN